MKYLSVCSGIEAVSVAWGPLGWQPAMFAEIDPFCCWLLHSRYRASRPTRFERYLDQYRPLFSALRSLELIYLSDVEKSFPFARAAFAAHFTETHIPGISDQTPLGVEHFLEYLRARETHEAQKHPVTLRDLAVLREGEPIYTTLEHQALYAAWKMQSTNAEKIRRRFMQHGPQAKFTTVALPYVYPLFSLKRERKTSKDYGSRLRSGQRSLLDES